MRIALKYLFHILTVLITSLSVVPDVYSDRNAGLLSHSADPFVYNDSDSRYYLFTTNANNIHIPVYSSSDLNQWKLVGNALPVLPTWATKGFTWAPEVIKINSKYVIYYTARHKLYDMPCIGVASSPNITGPYIDGSDEPLVCQVDQGGSIDPSPFRNDDGRLYLLWKGNGNKVKIKTQLWIGALSDDGKALTGQFISLLKNDAPWEGISIEAPTLLKYQAKYYLFYSGAMFNTPRYAVGYAVSDNLMGPYIKSKDSPILKTDDDMLAPGHAGIFLDKSKKYWIVFHAYDGSIKRGNRKSQLKRLEWMDGAPRVINVNQ